MKQGKRTSVHRISRSRAVSQAAGEQPGAPPSGRGGTKGSQDVKIPALPIPPKASSDAVRASMRANVRVDTSPELLLRRALHALGLRYFVDRRVIAAGVGVRPDVVFPGVRIAVFLDGCFWHGCEVHGTKPKANGAYWAAKLARNRARDQRVNEALKMDGWRVLRFWEHDDPTLAARRIATAVQVRRRVRVQA